MPRDFASTAQSADDGAGVCRFVAYYRVSTEGQGRSGLGLDAQRASVAAYVTRRGVIASEFVEVESGRKNARPELAKALKAAKAQGATLLIAKLDRLARNTAFIANLLEGGVEIAAADLPQADRFILHIMAALAEKEAHMISERTKAALAQAKARGVRLGYQNPAIAAHHVEASRKGGETNKAKAQAFAANVSPIIREMKGAGLTTLQQLADGLNARGVQTARGGAWYPATVRNVMRAAE